MRLTFTPLTVCFRLAVKHEGLEAILGAAFLMTDRAYVMLAGDRARLLRVRLRPKVAGGKKALTALAGAFESELAKRRIRGPLTK